MKHSVVRTSPAATDDGKSSVQENPSGVSFPLQALSRDVAQAALERTCRMDVSLPPNSLRIIAHELRSPLTTVRLALQLAIGRLQRGDTLDPNALQKALAQVDEVTALIAELSDAAGIASNGWPLAPEVVDLTELLESAVAAFSRHSGSPQVLLALGARKVNVRGDRSGLDRVVSSLLENAAQFSLARAPITVSLSIRGAEVELSVTDQGIGIPHADQPHIFEMFFRASNASNASTKGFGLNLFVCRTIIVGHEGRIWFESEPGKGSTFYVALRRVDQSSDG